MNALSFEDAFLKMPPRERAIIREYCRLYEDSSLGVDALVDRLSRIWNQAVGHSGLLACLQLADYIYADNGDKGIDDDKRVYLCEHLGDEVGLNSDSLEPGSAIYSRDLWSGLNGESFLLKCEDGNYTTVFRNESSSKDIPEASVDWVCSHCNKGFSSHRVIRLEGVLPD